MTRIDKLKNSGAAYRLSGILDCVQDKNLSIEEKEALMQMKNDAVVLAGREMAAYAIAALDVLKVEQYNGDSQDIKELIAAM